jgi:hypothetical protein
VIQLILGRHTLRRTRRYASLRSMLIPQIESLRMKSSTLACVSSEDE